MTNEPHATLRTTLHSTLAPFLPGAQECDAIDYPDHYNVGDAALWLGQRQVLRDLGVGVRSVSTRSTYHAGRLKARGPLVFMGGGNLGGLYRSHHELKLQVLADFPDRPVIQLPQSVEYADEEAREELRRALSKHPDVTVLLRDQRSYEIAQRDFDCPTALAPDMALGLGDLTRRPPKVGLVAQVRTDQESSGQRPVVSDIRFDWLQARRYEPVALYQDAYRLASAVQRRRQDKEPDQWFVRLSDAFAKANLRRGIRLLSQGERLVTDRLHGHVLACLLGIPHVVVADRFGKVEALWRTWTNSFANAAFSPSWAEAALALESLPD
jgi:pyruvyl transferase EpsO